MIQTENGYLPSGDKHPILPITTIGRSKGNTIPLNDHHASGEHAALSVRNQQVWLEDRGSSNGTRLNDERVQNPVVVTTGDIITIGQTTFRVELEQ